MADEKTALEVLEEAVQHPTLDHFLDRNPRKLTEEDLRNLVVTLRKERAMFIQVKEEKKEKKNVSKQKLV